MKNATSVLVSTFGAVMALAGIEHGIGEILQGSVAPQGIMILSWPEAEFFRSLGGEPALTVIPNLLLTGILAVLVSLALLVWSVRFTDHPYGGWVMILLSLAMLLVGGGIFPPILGILIGVVAVVGRNKPDRPPVTGMRGWVGKSWRWIFAACCLAWLTLFPGVAVLSYFFGIEDEGVTLAIMVAAFVLLFLSSWSSIQADRLNAYKAPDNHASRSAAIFAGRRQTGDENR